MQHKTKIVAGRCIINLSGSFDFEDHPTFKEILDMIQAEKVTSVTFELSQLKSINAAGVAMLLIGWKTAHRHNISIILEKPNKSVLRTLLEAKLDSLFNIVE